ncbi:MAG: ECF-type sigma factor [Acidobacteriota bacterium]
MTLLLHQLHQGDSSAFDRLLQVVYDDLKKIAHWQLLKLSSKGTLATTELVHETYFKLAAQANPDWQSRRHFLRISSRAMRQVIVDMARRRSAAKRDHGREPYELLDVDLAIRDDIEKILTIDQALNGLAGLNERLSSVVECRFFAGLTEEETAEALGVSLSTAQRDWKQARAWLKKSLQA